MIKTMDCVFGVAFWCCFDVPYPADKTLRANYLIHDQELQERLLKVIKLKKEV